MYSADRGKEIDVFGPDGEYLRTIGRAGQGPGEYQGLTAVRLDETGKLFTFDLIAGDLTVFSQDYEFERHVRLDIHPNPTIVLMPNGELTVVSDEATPETIGLALHRLNAEGHRVFSFGPLDGGRYIPSDETLRHFARVTALAKPDGVWSVLQTRYLIELWGSAGERKLALQREAAWFPQRIEGPIQSDAPQVSAVQEDSEGLLWVLIRVPSEKWLQIRTGDSGRSPRLNDEDWDTVIELIDARARTVLARTRVPQYLDFVDDRLVGAVSDQGFDSYLYIFQLHFAQRKGGGASE